MPDTPARPELLDKTDIARIFRKVYGGTRYSETEYLFAREIEKLTQERARADERRKALEEIFRMVDAELFRHPTSKCAKNLDRAIRYLLDKEPT